MYDMNGMYETYVSKGQWKDSMSNGKDLEDCISIVVSNIPMTIVPGSSKIPETELILSIEDAKQLRGFLDVLLDGE